MIEDMADRMVDLVDLVADLSLRSVTERLAKLLLEEAIDGVLVRPRWLTLPELAARLGTVPDVVQRALGRLAADGVVESSAARFASEIGAHSKRSRAEPQRGPGIPVPRLVPGGGILSPAAPMRHDSQRSRLRESVNLLLTHR